MYKISKYLVTLLICSPLFSGMVLSASIKHVITGGPSTGKTTLINALKREGYKIIEEAATCIITADLKKGSENPNTHPDTFQVRVTEKQIENELVLNSEDEAFLDRGIIDGIAYSNFYKDPIPKILTDYIKEEKNKYANVFLLDPVYSYEKNDVRLESEADAKKLHNDIKLAYEEAGYTVTVVPLCPVSERIEFILNKIKDVKNLSKKQRNS